MRHAGAGQEGSPETLHGSVQTAGGGRAFHPVPAGGRDPDRYYGRGHPGVHIPTHSSDSC